MPRKFRIITYLIVAFLIPIGIYILYPEDWLQTLPWIAFVGVIALVYEIYSYNAGKK